jgi:hypothetical protein
MLKRDETCEPIDAEDQDPFFGPLSNLQRLAERQGVKPVASLEDGDGRITQRLQDWIAGYPLDRAYYRVSASATALRSLTGGILSSRLEH